MQVYVLPYGLGSAFPIAITTGITTPRHYGTSVFDERNRNDKVGVLGTELVRLRYLSASERSGSHSQ